MTLQVERTTLGAMRQNIYRWFDRNQWAADAALTLIMLVFWLGFSFNFGATENILSLVAIVPLFFRRTFPVQVLITSITIQLITLLVTDNMILGSLVVFPVIHASVVYAPTRFWGRIALAAGLVGAIAGPSKWELGLYSPQRFVAMVGVIAGACILAFIAGERQRDRLDHVAEQVASLEERSHLLTLERDQRVQMAAAGERTRIARELHDIVAHSLAVIVVQADGGAAAVKKKPELAEQVLKTIADTSRDALAEMRGLVGVLRADPLSHPSVGGETFSDTGFAPQPGIKNLPTLVDQVRQAGVIVELQVAGLEQDLPAGADLTVYRVVQEALTNVLKHAGPAARADVELWVEEPALGGPGVLMIDVTDTGRGAAAVSDGAGNGLVGMRERVALHGGSVLARPRAGGGFRVLATLPVPGLRPATPPESDAPTGPLVVTAYSSSLVKSHPDSMA